MTRIVINPKLRIPVDIKNNLMAITATTHYPAEAEEMLLYVLLSTQGFKSYEKHIKGTDEAEEVRRNVASIDPKTGEADEVCVDIVKLGYSRRDIQRETLKRLLKQSLMLHELLVSFRNEMKEKSYHYDETNKYINETPLDLANVPMELIGQDHDDSKVITGLEHLAVLLECINSHFQRILKNLTQKPSEKAYYILVYKLVGIFNEFHKWGDIAKHKLASYRNKFVQKALSLIYPNYGVPELTERLKRLINNANKNTHYIRLVHIDEPNGPNIISSFPPDFNFHA
ncbi:MAG TPA: hypothetical protein PK878_08840 [bacterium]|nr:hypothetical protein [bacterium]HOL95792.1 hypothetical protein [bacterium]HPP01565.1 hypothetical protein [bacterium]